MFQNAKFTYRDRKTTASFDGPALESTPEDGAEVWHERIKVSFTHNKSKKAYEAHVSWCKAAERDGYGMEQVAIFTDAYVLLATAPAARFSENKFEAFCAEVQGMCEIIASDTLVVGAAADLLRKANSFALVKN